MALKQTAFGYYRDNLLKLGCWLRSPREVRHYLNRALWETGYPWTKIPPLPLAQIFPGVDVSAGQLRVQNPFARRRGTSLELDELLALLAIAVHIGARDVVEIGTFDGNTALNLALNMGGQGTVVTVDLPPPGSTEDSSGQRGPDAFANRQYIGQPVESRIRQVYGDSAKLDWNSVGGPFDLAFIDGDHSARYVMSDTAHVLSVLKPGGCVVWHDYELRPVAAVLDRAADRGDEVHWIQGTRLAVATFSDPLGSVQNFAD